MRHDYNIDSFIKITMYISKNLIFKANSYVKSYDIDIEVLLKVHRYRSVPISECIFDLTLIVSMVPYGSHVLLLHRYRCVVLAIDIFVHAYLCFMHVP